MDFKIVDFQNAKEAIDVQRKIFPSEDGLLNILASLDRKLFIETTGLDYVDDHVKYFLAYMDNKAIGITGLYYYADHPEEMWIAWFGVLPECRRKGYATTILNWTIQKAIAANKKVIRLYTDAQENVNAINLYTKLGFQGEKYLVEKLSYDCYIYSKGLDKDFDIAWHNRNLGLAYQSTLEKVDNNKKEEIYKTYAAKYLGK